MRVIYFLCIQISLLEKQVNIAAGTPNRSVQLVSSWIYKVVGCRFSLYSGFFPVGFYGSRFSVVEFHYLLSYCLGALLIVELSHQGRGF